MDVKKAPPLPPPPVPPRPAGESRPMPASSLNEAMTPPAQPAMPQAPAPQIDTPATKQVAVAAEPLQKPGLPTTLPTPADVPDVVIRTMQDDKRDIKLGTLPPPKPPSVAVPTPASPASPAAPAASANRAFPLAPKDAGTAKQKVVLSPNVARRSGRALKVIILTALVLLVLGGGGFAAWYLLQSANTQPGQEAVISEAVQVLPAESVVLLQYKLQSLQDRNDIATAWNAKSQTATLASLVEGDPRLLLTEPTVTEFYYVVLDGNTRPFLVVPKTAETTRLIATGADVHFIEYEGWYVVHALTTAPYEAAVQAGVLAPTADAGFIKSQPTGPLRFVLGRGALPQLRTDIAGPKFLAGGLQSLQLTGVLEAGTVRLGGTATQLGTVSAGSTDMSLLASLPPTLSFARLGANFAADIQEWLTVTNTVDEEILNRPVVKQLVSQLTGPYALFRGGAAGNESFGLVVTLPSTVTPPLTIDDTALEEAMPAMVPLLLDQRTVAPVTFNPATYAGRPLRYANIVGTTKALDYALTDTHLIVGTSKEMMFSLLDIAYSTAPSLATATTPWQAVWTVAETPQPHDVVFGHLTLPAVIQLLPTARLTVPVGLATVADAAILRVTGIIDIADATASSTPAAVDSPVVPAP